MASERQPPLELRPKQGSAGHCPLCRDQVLVAAGALCGACGANYHRACLEEFGQNCAVSGCGVGISLPTIVVPKSSLQRPQKSSPTSHEPAKGLPSRALRYTTGAFWLFGISIAIEVLERAGHHPGISLFFVGLVGWWISALAIQALLDRRRQG